MLVFAASLVYNRNKIYNLPRKRPGPGEAATAEERDEGEDLDLRYRDVGEEGGEGLQACHREVGERPLCLRPGWRSTSAGCARSPGYRPVAVLRLTGGPDAGARVRRRGALLSEATTKPGPRQMRNQGKKEASGVGEGAC